MAAKLVVGCGYLGRRVADLWRGQGHRVHVTTRSESRAEEFRRAGLQPVVCDVLEPGTLLALRQLPADVGTLYCVGLDRAAGRPMREVYVDGLGHVLAHLPGGGRLLYVSSTSVYGQDAGEEVDEAAPAEPREESGRVVRDAERLLAERRPDAVVLRFAGLYGPDRLLRNPALAAGEPLAGDPDRWLNLIHVEDGAAAVLAAEARARAGGVYNVCDDRPMRRGEFYGLLARLLGAPPPRFVPAAPGEWSGRNPSANRRISNRRLRQELQAVLRYPSFEQGLPAAVTASRSG